MKPWAKWAGFGIGSGETDGQAYNRIWFGVKGNGVPRIKTYLESKDRGLRPESIIFSEDTGTNESSKNHLKEMFNNVSVFETPKPVHLIKHLIQIGATDGIILDFFSGSSATAHAVMALNASDASNRKFIQVQLPETLKEGSEGYKVGYRNICEIGKERIRRAAKEIKEETGADIDYGFRVYRLAESNMQDVYHRPQDFKQETLDLFADNVKPDRTADDLLAQVMLAWGLPLSLRIERATIAGKEVFRVEKNSLLACFDKGVDEAFAKEAAKEKPLRILFRDSGFKDDTSKENVRQLLKQLSPDTEMRVI